jgi:hypothetical protein
VKAPQSSQKIKCGHGSRGVRKPRNTVLARASSNLTASHYGVRYHVICGVNHLKYSIPICSDMKVTVRMRTVKEQGYCTGALNEVWSFYRTRRHIPGKDH